jgi:indole-3-glycerol phosphate synthase
MSRLAAILREKEREVRAIGAEPRALVAGELAAGADAAAPRLDVPSALRRSPGAPLRLIAEVKLRSPSAGALSRALSPDARAVAYAEAGASMVSVLCDQTFFDGSWEHLRLARRALDARFAQVPLLAKEFVIDECQIRRARDCGADAVLLIARIVAPQRLSELARAAREAQIEPLIEVVDEAELEAARAAEARVVGVNARDLDTLAMDTARAARVLRAIAPDVVAVHLSGLREPADVAAVAAGRPDAALIGEALMREDDPRDRLRALVAAAK